MCKLVSSSKCGIEVKQVTSSDPIEGYMTRKSLFTKGVLITAKQVPSTDTVAGSALREDVYNQFFK